MPKIQRKYKLILVVAAIVFIIAVISYYENAKNEIFQNEINLMQDMVDGYASDIENWLELRKIESKNILSIPSVKRNVTSLLTHNKLSKRDENDLLSTLKILEHQFHYRRALLLNLKLEPKLSTSQNIKTYQDEIYGAKKALKNKEITFSDIHLQNKSNGLEIDLLIPVWGGLEKEKKLIGLFVAELNPVNVVNSKIGKAHNLRTKTGEYIIAFEKKYDHSEVVVINRLRHLHNKPLEYSFKPLESALTFYDIFIKDTDAFFGKDYRNKEVIAVNKLLSKNNWVIVSKIDQDEVLAELNLRTSLLSGIFATLVLAIGFVISSISKKHQSEFYEEKYKLERGKRSVEKELIENEKRLRESQKVAKLASWSIDLTTGKLYVSDEFYLLLGYDKDQIETSFENFSKFFNPADAEKLAQKSKESRKLGGKPFKMDVEYHNHKGENRFGHFRVTYEKNYRGEIAKATGTFQDITGRKKVENKLIDYKTKLEKAQSMAHMGFINWDLKTNTLDISDEILKLLGIEQKDFKGPEDMKKLVHPDDLKLVIDNLDLAVKDEKKYNIDHRLLRPGGEIIWVHAQAELKKDKDGTPIKLLGIVINITERIEKESLILLQSKAIQSSANAIIISNAKREIVWVNRAFTKMTGYNLDEVAGTKARDFLDANKNDDRLYEEIGNKIYNGEVWAGEIVDKTKEGVLVYTKTTITPFYDAITEERKFISIKENITERKLAFELIKKNEEKYRKFFEEDISGDLITKPDGTILECNPAFIKIMGFNSKEEALSSDACKFYRNKQDRETFLKELKEKKYIDYKESEFINNQGEDIHVILNAEGIFDDEGNLERIQSYLVDITELKKTQIEFVKVNKVKDDFIANISHEIRTPLNIILGMTNLIKEEFEEHIIEDSKVLFDGVESASKRLIRTIEMILNLSRLQAGEMIADKSEINILNICTDLIKEFSAISKNKKLKLLLENKSKNTTILADDYKIRESISNLIDNAIKYTNEGFVKLKLHENSKNETLLEISDSGIGIGIEQEKLKTIFEPYLQEDMGYSRNYEGVGLGLSIVKKYLELNDFTISVLSKKNKGTTFTINFGKREV